MKIFDIDGPLMHFLGNAFDFFMIFVLTVLLSLPVVTAGAAMTAGQYVSMKIMRKEAPKVFPSYFRAFKENFKQATLLWLIQLIILLVVAFDWYYILLAGWGNVFIGYRAFLVLATCVVFFVNLTLYSVIARFRMKNKDIMKTAIVLSVTIFPFLAILVVLFAAIVFCCFWFINLFPAFFIIGFTGLTALHGFIMMKACARIEKKFEGQNPDPSGEPETDHGNV